MATLFSYLVQFGMRQLLQNIEDALYKNSDFLLLIFFPNVITKLKYLHHFTANWDIQKEIKITPDFNKNKENKD